MKSKPSEIKENQSIELLKELHILTREGQLNQDSRRKLKQIYHLYHFIEPLLKSYLDPQLHSITSKTQLTLVDHGAGKSYLGFIIYDLFFKEHQLSSKVDFNFVGVEFRDELVKKSTELAQKLKFEKMFFKALDVKSSLKESSIPDKVQIVTALHACDTATDDAIDFGLHKKSEHFVLVPCCQAELAQVFRKNKAQLLANPLSELVRFPIHTREFGSHLTNVLRVLKLISQGYDVTVTELVGFEHSMKNELIIASKHHNKDKNHHVRQAFERIETLLKEFKLQDLNSRFLNFEPQVIG